MIESRKRNFEKASIDIEAMLAKGEERERKWLEADDEEQSIGNEHIKKELISEASTSKKIAQSSVYNISKVSGEIQQEKNILLAGKLYELY